MRALAVRPGSSTGSPASSSSKLTLMRPLSLAAIFAALCSLTAGWATVLEGAAATSTWSAAGVSRLLMGSAETLSPVFTTFGILAVSWLLVTVGMRRQARSVPAPTDEEAGPAVN